MNRIGLIAMLAALGATSAYAQQPVPGVATPQQVQPSGAPAKPEARPPRLVQNEKRHARDADARQCLEQASNKQIHRCSLKYRSHASRAAPVKRASTKAAAEPPPPPPMEISKPPAAAPAKAGAPKPADTAKAADLVKPMDVTKAGAVPKPEAAKAPEPAKAAAPATQTPPPPPAKAPEPAKK